MTSWAAQRPPNFSQIQSSKSGMSSSCSYSASLMPRSFSKTLSVSSIGSASSGVSPHLLQVGDQAFPDAGVADAHKLLFLIGAELLFLEGLQAVRSPERVGCRSSVPPCRRAPARRRRSPSPACPWRWQAVSSLAGWASPPAATWRSPGHR